MDQGMEITEITQGGQAERVGLSVGMKVVAINAQSVLGHTLVRYLWHTRVRLHGN